MLEVAVNSHENEQKALKSRTEAASAHIANRTPNCFLPRRPHLVAAATNTGAVLLSFDTNERPPVVALPAQVGRAAAVLAAPAAAPLACTQAAM